MLSPHPPPCLALSQKNYRHPLAPLLDCAIQKIPAPFSLLPPSAQIAPQSATGSASDGSSATCDHTNPALPHPSLHGYAVSARCSLQWSSTDLPSLDSSPSPHSWVCCVPQTVRKPHWPASPRIGLGSVQQASAPSSSFGRRELWGLKLVFPLVLRGLCFCKPYFYEPRPAGWTIDDGPHPR